MAVVRLDPRSAGKQVALVQASAARQHGDVALSFQLGADQGFGRGFGGGVAQHGDFRGEVFARIQCDAVALNGDAACFCRELCGVEDDGTASGLGRDIFACLDFGARVPGGGARVAAIVREGTADGRQQEQVAHRADRNVPACCDPPTGQRGVCGAGNPDVAISPHAGIRRRDLS